MDDWLTYFTQEWDRALGQPNLPDFNYSYLNQSAIKLVTYFKKLKMSPVECTVHCRRNTTNEVRVKTTALNTR